MPTESLTYVEHRTYWSTCQACKRCHDRATVVVGHGQLPCDVLVVSDKPDDDEDATGNVLPNTGPVGRVLATAMDEAWLDSPEEPYHLLTTAYTCLLACKGDKLPARDLLACRPRLEEFLQLAQPRAVLLLGNEVNRVWARHPRPIPTYTIQHPRTLAWEKDEGTFRLGMAKIRLTLKRLAEDLVQ